ncbi:MAG: VanZ family protein [Anaerolineae bacterium]|nr:VanZ family protein [Anaerolineae bacterium]
MKKATILLAAVFTVFILVIVVLADQGRLPGFITVLIDFPNGDKLGHFLLMGGLSLLVNLALPAGADRRHILALWLVAVLVALEEISQSWFGTRHPDLTDLLASLAGIVLLGKLGWWINNTSYSLIRRPGSSS